MKKESNEQEETGPTQEEINKDIQRKLKLIEKAFR